MPSTRRHERGTTLLEILIAMTILGILAAGIFGAFVFSRRVSASSSGRLIATEFAQQTAEHLRGSGGTAALTAGNHTQALPAGNPLQPFAGTRTYRVRNGKFNPTTGAVTWSPNAQGQVQNDADGRPINDTNYDLKEVRILVHWDPPAS